MPSRTDAELAEVMARVARLGAWVRSERFAAGRPVHKVDALLELGRLRESLAVIRAIRAQEAEDERNAVEAVAWVEADDAETEAELYETLARTIPRRGGERWRAYLGRLRRFRETVRDPLLVASAQAANDGPGRKPRVRT